MDETCRMMAEACVNIQAGAAAQAMQALALPAHDHAQGSAGDLLGGGGASRGLIMPGAAGAWPDMGLSIAGGAPSAVQSHVGVGRKAPLVVEIAGIRLH